MVSSSCTDVVRFIRSPFAVFKVCWRWVTIPVAPAMAGTVIRRVPSTLCQRHREHRLALGGMVSSRSRRLVLRSSGRVMTCFMVSISQPRTTFLCSRWRRLCGDFKYRWAPTVLCRPCYSGGRVCRWRGRDAASSVVSLLALLGLYR